jgi:hypothetical protein
LKILSSAYHLHFDKGTKFNDRTSYWSTNVQDSLNQLRIFPLFSLESAQAKNLSKPFETWQDRKESINKEKGSPNSSSYRLTVQGLTSQRMISNYSTYIICWLTIHRLHIGKVEPRHG